MKTHGTFKLEIDGAKVEKQLEGVVFAETLEECADLPLHSQPSFSEAKAYAAKIFKDDPDCGFVVLNSLRGCGGLTPGKPFFAKTTFLRNGIWHEVCRL